MHLGEPASEVIQTGTEERGSLDAQSPGAAQRRGCWELAGKRKWPVRGPGRAEVQEEGRALSRDPGWRRLIPLWTRSWRWGLGTLWEEGRRGPQAAQALLLVPLSFGQKRGDRLEFLFGRWNSLRPSGTPASGR